MVFVKDRLIFVIVISLLFISGCVLENRDTVAGKAIGNPLIIDGKEISPGQVLNQKYFVQSYVPDESRVSPPVRRGFCFQANQCIRNTGECVTAGGVVGDLTCGPDHNWGYFIRSYIPGESRVQPASRHGVCPQANQCIRNTGKCVNAGSIVGDLTCSSDHNWGYAVRSYIPGESRARPASRSGICQQQGQCIRLNGICVNTNDNVDGLTCGSDGNWGYFILSTIPNDPLPVPMRFGICQSRTQCITQARRCFNLGQIVDSYTCGKDNKWGYSIQSYIPGENRARPATRRSVCQNSFACVTLNGECVSLDEISGTEFLCGDNNNWEKCGRSPSSTVTKIAGDLSENLKYSCDGTRWREVDLREQMFQQNPLR